MLLYKVSVKTFVKHRHISRSKERKPRDNVVLTFVWDVTKTRNVGSKNKHGEREIEKIGTKQRIGNEVTVPIFHFPVSHSLSPLPAPRSPFPVTSPSVESVDTVKTKPRCSPTIYGP